EQTLEELGDCLNLPSSSEVLPELTPCGDVGLVSAKGLQQTEILCYQHTKRLATGLFILAMAWLPPFLLVFIIPFLAVV
ncbi:hypothetical protein O5559_29050, partial [Escherichia coli]|nr:hypothetical protein [Escherichia coli]